jgi:hypothetical protein
MQQFFQLNAGQIFQMRTSRKAFEDLQRQAGARATIPGDCFSIDLSVSIQHNHPIFFVRSEYN